MAWLCNWQAFELGPFLPSPIKFNLPRLWPTLPWEKNGWKMLRPWQTGSLHIPVLNFNLIELILKHDFDPKFIQDHWYEDRLEGRPCQGGKLSQLAAHHWPGLHWKTTREAPNWSLISLESSLKTWSGILDWHVLLHRYDPRASWRDYQEPLRIPHQGEQTWIL